MARTERPTDHQTVQLRKRGVMTFPKAFREKHGLEEGDALHLVDLGGGMFVITPMMPAVPGLAEEINRIRQREGISLEALLEGLKEQRERLADELYGPAPEESISQEDTEDDSSL